MVDTLSVKTHNVMTALILYILIWLELTQWLASQYYFRILSEIVQIFCDYTQEDGLDCPVVVMLQQGFQTSGGLAQRGTTMFWFLICWGEVLKTCSTFAIGNYP